MTIKALLAAKLKNRQSTVPGEGASCATTLPAGIPAAASLVAAAGGGSESARAAVAAVSATGPAGAVVLLQAGGVVVTRIGSIVHDRAAYHSRRFLYPVDFSSLRAFASYRQVGLPVFSLGPSLF